MNLQQNQLYQSGVANLNAAMDSIKFNGSVTPDECAKIRAHINNARSEFSTLSQVQPDHSGQFGALLKMADTLEKAVDSIDDSKTYL